jgi:hypothetical protein
VICTSRSPASASAAARRAVSRTPLLTMLAFVGIRSPNARSRLTQPVGLSSGSPPKSSSSSRRAPSSAIRAEANSTHAATPRASSLAGVMRRSPSGVFWKQ